MNRFIMSAIVAASAFTTTGCGDDNSENYEVKSQSCLGSCPGDTSDPVHVTISPVLKAKNSAQRFAAYGINLSSSDRAHWDHHRTNVSSWRWEWDFRKDVVTRVFAARGCTKTGNDHMHWQNHLANNMNNVSKFMSDVRNDCP